MKRILILGIKGMAGHVIYHYFKHIGNFEVHGLARNIATDKYTFSADVSDTDKISNIIRVGQYDFIINCIGILNKDAEENPDKAVWYNSYFPHFLEHVTQNSHTKVIHISTDCVFDGKKGGYVETDFKDGVGFYAQSKALGEVVNDKDLTIRTSIIGPELNEKGIGLFHWFMNQDHDANILGYKRAFWTGVTTIELAEIINAAIQQNLYGLIQIVPSKKISKYELLLIFKDVFKKQALNVIPDESYIVDKSLISIRSDFDYQVKDYQQMVKLQRDWILDNPNLYPHYL